MTLNFIEYLENKNFEVDEIILLQKTYARSSLDEDKMIKKMDAIYKVFMFAGLSELQVNELICNNPGLLQKSDHELIEIAYVWGQTGLLPDLTKKNRGLQTTNCLRIFLRNSYLNSGIRPRKSTISHNTLTMFDERFLNDYEGLLNGEIFSPSFEALIDIFGKGNSFDEKREYIDSLVSASSLKWYLDCLKKEKLKENERKLI